MNKEQPPSNIKNWGFSGYASLLLRINVFVGGQKRNPLSPTFHI